MSFFRTTPKETVSEKAFRKQFQEQVLIVCDMRTAPGRRRHSVLGDRREQMTRTVSAEIGTALVEQMEALGRVFDPTAQHLYEVHGRGKWCATEVTNMARINKTASHPDPYMKITAMLGLLIPIGTRKVIGERKEIVRIATVSATSGDLMAVAATLSDAGRKTFDANDAAADHIRNVADMMRKIGGQSLEEAMAIYSDAIRRGEVSQ